MNSSDALAAHEAEERLRDAAPIMLEALTSLRNEIQGQWSWGEHALRAELGNTNYQVVLDKLAEANAAIAKATGKQP
jgi:hypothetical protein